MLKMQWCRTLRGLTLRLAQTFAQLSPEAQRAIWACRIIKEISEAKEETDYFEEINGKRTIKPSLADTIKGLTLKSVECGQDQLDDEIRKDVLKMFTTGIVPNYNIFTQQRIFNGSKTSHMQEKSKTPFIFYPNALVTKFMFNKIRSQIQKQIFLLYGTQGTSKSVAIILFHYLSSMINQYLYKAHSSQVQMKELSVLMDRKLIYTVPKIFYYSHQTNMYQKQLVRMIKKQCTEVIQIQKDSQRLQQINNQNQLEKIRQLYSNRGIKILVVFDQLDDVTYNLRSYNYSIKKTKMTSYDHHNLEYKLKYIEESLQRIKQLQKLGDHMFFNISTDIAKELLEKQTDPSPNCIYTLDFNGQTNVHREDLPYEKFLSQPWGQVSFSHYLWFQIQRNLVSSSIAVDAIDRIKLIYYQRVSTKGHQWPIYLNFYQMWQKIYCNLKHQGTGFPPPFMNVTQKCFAERLDQTIKYFFFQSSMAFLDKITQFIRKGTIGEKKIKFELINILNKYATNNIYQMGKLFKIPLEYLNMQIGQQITSLLVQQADVVKLFSIYIEEEQKIKFAISPFTPTEFKIFSSFVLSNYSREYLTFFQDMTPVLLQNTKSLESCVKLCYLQMLTKPRSKIQLIVQTPQTTQYQTITVNKVIHFLHFNSKNRKIWDSFTHLLKAASNNKYSYFVGVPTTLFDTVNGKIDTMTMVQKNSCFCIATVRCVDNFFYINTFDITITRQISQIRKKVARAAKLLDQITSDIICNSKENDQMIHTHESEKRNTEIEEKQKELAEEKYPTFVPVKQNKNFVVRHIIVLPKQILGKVKVSQIEDELVFKKNNKNFNYEAQYRYAKTNIAHLLRINQDEVKVEEKPESQILTYNTEKWSICYASFEDIEEMNKEQSLESKSLKTVLKMMDFKEGV